MGATRALVIDVLPDAPGIIAQDVRAAPCECSRRFERSSAAAIEVVRLAPPALLGAPLESIYWTRPNAEAWIRAGRNRLPQ